MIESVLFYILAALLLGLGLVVVLQTNPLASALALVGAFAALASLYGLLAASLVAVLQILVYAGGIMVLMIFVIMLLNLREGELHPLRMRPAVLAASLAATVMGLAVPLALRFVPLEGLSGATVGPGFGGLKASADLLFGPFLFPFEMLSLLLLSALVGALVLSKRRI